MARTAKKKPGAPRGRRKVKQTIPATSYTPEEIRLRYDLLIHFLNFGVDVHQAYAMTTKAFNFICGIPENLSTTSGDVGKAPEPLPQTNEYVSTKAPDALEDELHFKKPSHFDHKPDRALI